MDVPMDEDGPMDEMMGFGGSKKPSISTQDDSYSPSVVSPDPSPTASDLLSAAKSRTRSTSSAGPPTSAFSRSSAGPPSNAFANKSSDRWAQYEMDDDRFREESAQASANAVASAATRVAMRDSSSSSSRRYYDDPDRHAIEDRLNKAGSSLPPPEPDTKSRSSRRTRGTSPKAEILRGLSRGRDMLASAASGTGNNDKSRHEEETVEYEDPHDRVRAEALKMLELADEKSPTNNIRRTASGGYSTTSEEFENSTSKSTLSSRTDGSKRVPAALSGALSFSSAGRASRDSKYRDDRFNIGDDDEEDHENELVDVVERERSMGAFDMEGEEQNKPASSWSSRYSVNKHLASVSSSMSPSAILSKWDRDNQTRPLSARKFSSGTHEVPSSPSGGGGLFGGFGFRSSNVFGKQGATTINLQSHKTVWMNADSNKSYSPPQVNINRTWQSELADKRRRRRRMCLLCLLTVILVIVLCAVFIDFGGSKNGSKSSGAAFNDKTVTFYVTADVPFDAAEDTKLVGDLKTLPGDAEFAIHLGNVQDSSVNLCATDHYSDAGSVLEGSPVTMFILPGSEDWNNCPNPDESLTWWKNVFLDFETNFDNYVVADHQLGQQENFAFTRRGVLFIGLHLVGGRIPDRDEFKRRHSLNVEWTEQKLSEDPDSYHAVVLLGNARPSQQQQEYFDEVLDDIFRIRKPVLYLHSDSGGGFEEYKPFPNQAPNLIAVQINDGGKSPPLRVSVQPGSSPFVYGRKTS